ncbi:transporter substrate-binding domain-containing protein [Nocardia sp. NPDC056000]|uniref:transporter substrate-binding domain-containing protein n=1 Tax=Nocardia sp. NPDC056000 TaxID=3345674 RepID=UPI0035D57180
MRRSRRLWSILNTILTGVLAVAGMAVPAAAEPSPSRLWSVPLSGVLRVCTTGDYPPFTVRDAGGNYRGVDISLAAELATMLHAVPQWVPTTWTTLTQDFLAHCDIAVGGISDTASRRAVADVSVATVTDGKTPVTRRSSGDAYSSIDEIDRPEVRVVVNPGGTNENFARTHFPQAQIMVWPDNLTIYDQLSHGQADVFVTDSIEGLYRQREYPDLQVLHPDKPFDSAAKVYLLPRGDTSFNGVVNAWLQVQISNGRSTALLGDWLS